MPTSRERGFTLVELILVMALLAIVMAFAAPSLSRSLRQRGLNGEALRFLALVDYARDEAISQGVPMMVWIDKDGRRFGVEAQNGYSGVESRKREFTLNPDIHFDVKDAVTVGGVLQPVEFSPDGSLDSSSVAQVRLVDRFDSALTVGRGSGSTSYKLQKEIR